MLDVLSTVSIVAVLNSVRKTLDSATTFFKALPDRFTELERLWPGNSFQTVINALDDIYFVEAETVTKLRLLALEGQLPDEDIGELHNIFRGDSRQISSAIRQITADNTRRLFGINNKLLIESLHDAANNKRLIRKKLAHIIRAARARKLKKSQRSTLNNVIDAIELLNSTLLLLRAKVEAFQNSQPSARRTAPPRVIENTHHQRAVAPPRRKRNG